MARKKSLDEGRLPREEILQRAGLLFCERGYDATSIRDIAEAAGLTVDQVQIPPPVQYKNPFFRTGGGVTPQDWRR